MMWIVRSHPDSRRVFQHSSMPDMGDNSTLVISYADFAFRLDEVEGFLGVNERCHRVPFALKQVRNGLENGTAWINDNASHAYSSQTANP